MEPLLEWQTWVRMVVVGASILVAIEVHKVLRRSAQVLGGNARLEDQS